MTRVVALLATLFLLSVLLFPFGIYGTFLTAGALFVAGLRTNPSPHTVSPRHHSLWAALALGGVLVLALVARWPIANHDVEHYVGPDEGEVVENVLEMVKTGDFDHRHPGYPGLHFYLQMIPARVHLKASGRTIPELPRSGFYLAARRLTLVAGLLAAVVVFRVGRMWLSSWSAAFGASLVLVSPLAFRESAVVNPDLMLMLFVSISLWLSLRLLEQRSARAFVLAGISVGLACAIKYTGGFAVAPYLVAWWLGPERRSDAGRVFFGLLAAGVAFAAASPYTLLNFPLFYRGLTMHVGYYRAAELNAPLALSRQLATRGVGVLASVAAFVASVRALVASDKRLLVLLAYPLTYWVVFSFFDRAFPRHALVLLPFAALLAADATERIAFKSRKSGIVVAAVLLAAPVFATLDVAARARRPTPAENAASWAVQNLEAGSRVLQDQFTPSLDPERFRVYRLRIEEKRFVGNYDYVFRSGYPPGLSTVGLREVARFRNEDAIGSGVTVYQVPDRASLMPVSTPTPDVRFGAGENPFFGDGWYASEAGAYETSRWSQGQRSEIYFKLPKGFAFDLTAELSVGAVSREPTRVNVFLNEHRLATLSIEGERGQYPVSFPNEKLNGGLNRLELRYERLTRRNRRRRDTAIRLYSVALSKVP